MGGDRVLVIVEFVIPVSIAVVNPLVAALAEIFHYPGTCRVLGHIVDAGEELNHILVSVGGVLVAAVRHPELIHSKGRPVTAGLVVGRGGRLFPAPASAVTDCSLAVIPLGILGCHEHNTVCTTRTVNGSCGSILNNGNAGNIGRINAVDISRHTIDEHERTGFIDGSGTADIQGSGRARITR